MKVIKTSELTGADLDWAVAKCEGENPFVIPFKNSKGATIYTTWGSYQNGIPYNPSNHWSQGIRIIERERIHIRPITLDGKKAWQCWLEEFPEIRRYGEILLVAAMRAYVASVFGDAVVMPKELEED